MNLTVLVICTQALFAGLLFAHEGSAQVKSVKEIIVNLDLSGATLRESFKAIEKQTNLNFAYDEKLITANEIKISYNKKRGTVESFLLHVSRQAGLKFRQVNDVVNVQRITSDVEDEVEVFLAEVTVTGIVTDESGEPLPGASIILKGTSKGTITDVNGFFSLEVPESDGLVLLVSFIGYENIEVPISGQTDFSIKMVPDVTNLDEVVVVGYGTQQKKDLTASVASLSEEEIENIPVTSVDALLQGRAAGVQVVNSSGAPGSANFVRIRGNNSLLSSNQPLFVVDGVPMNEFDANVGSLNTGGQTSTGFNDINPNDIASIEILKDAAATAIYGSRATNGVVLITTKRGKSGEAKFEFNTYFGTQRVWNKLDLLNSQQYEDFIVESINNENEFRDVSNPLTIPDQIRANGIDTDWQNEVFRSAPISSHNLSMSAGNEKTQYFTSLSYFNQEGTIKGQHYQRVTGRINIDHQALDNFKVGSNLTLTYSNNDRLFADFDEKNPLAVALISRPNLPVYDEFGNYSVDNLSQIPNPVQMADEIIFNNQQKRVIGNLYAEYEIIEGLELRSSWGIDFLADNSSQYIPNTFVGQAVAEAYASNYEELLWSIETTLSYNKNINDHQFSAMLGNTIQESDKSFLSAGGSNAGSNIVTTVGAISEPGVPNQRIETAGLLSYFSRLFYNYKDKYLFTVTGRYDGSSRFPDGNKWGFFPSFSVGWRVSNEPFLQGASKLSDLKVRASYGVVGNQAGVGAYEGFARYGTGLDYTSSLPGIGLAGIFSDDLGWESTSQTNIGLDLTLFDSRINLTIDVYKKLTEDLLYPKVLPYTAGFAGQTGLFNIGEVSNKGLDVTFTTQNLRGAFTWTTSFNINFNRNEIDALPDYNPDEPTSADFYIQQQGGFGTDGVLTGFRVGQPIGTFFGYKVDQIDPQTGGLLYVDANGDGSFGGDSDRVILGTSQPDHTGGLTNNFSYKNIDLSVFLQWSYGNEIYNQTAAVIEQMEGYNNQDADILNRWQNPGDITDVPRATFEDVTGRYTPGLNNTEISDRFLEDGSYLRIKDISLGYTLPKALVNSVGIDNLRLYGSVRNAFTFTSYSGFDPESQNTSNPTSIGVDYLTQPQPRTFIIGLDILF